MYVKSTTKESHQSESNFLKSMKLHGCMIYPHAIHTFLGSQIVNVKKETKSLLEGLRGRKDRFEIDLKTHTNKSLEQLNQFIHESKRTLIKSKDRISPKCWDQLALVWQIILKMKLGASARIFPWNQRPLLWELCANFLFAFSHLWSISHPQRATAHFKYLFRLHLKLFQYGDDLKWCFCCWGEYLSSFSLCHERKTVAKFPVFVTYVVICEHLMFAYLQDKSQQMFVQHEPMSLCYCEDVYHCWLFVRMCLKKVNFCSSWTAAVHLADAAHLKQMMLILSRQRLFISAQPLPKFMDISEQIFKEINQMKSVWSSELERFFPSSSASLLYVISYSHTLYLHILSPHIRKPLWWPSWPAALTSSTLFCAFPNHLNLASFRHILWIYPLTIFCRFLISSSSLHLKEKLKMLKLQNLSSHKIKSLERKTDFHICM